MLRGGSNISVVKAEVSFCYSTLFPSLHHNFGLESGLSLKLARSILVTFAKTEKNQPNYFQVMSC